MPRQISSWAHALQSIMEHYYLFHTYLYSHSITFVGLRLQHHTHNLTFNMMFNRGTMEVFELCLQYDGILAPSVYSYYHPIKFIIRHGSKFSYIACHSQRQIYILVGKLFVRVWRGVVFASAPRGVHFWTARSTSVHDDVCQISYRHSNIGYFLSVCGWSCHCGLSC